ncbi:ribonuclease P protein component [Candidatus Parcubacteria bacterium]|nr:MAG: ribonuclease P protein component [Candidatus Parcubacteria bacterium]
MLAKANRLHLDNDIKRLLKSGKTFFLPQYIIKFTHNKDQKQPKIGFVVSNKVDKRAVKRNQVKRRLREAAREMLPRINNEYSLLIIAKKEALELEYKDVKKQLDFAFSKMKIYN